jgi:hypothetical protein
MVVAAVVIILIIVRPLGEKQRKSQILLRRSVRLIARLSLDATPHARV